MAVWTAVLGLLSVAGWGLGKLCGVLAHRGGYATAAEVGCGLGLLWKFLGTLLYPVLKSYLSRSPSLGFIHLVTVRRTELERSALDKIDGALRSSLPLRVARVHTTWLQLAVGPLAGLRLRAGGLRVELEWAPREAWEAAAQDIRDAELNSSRALAQAGIGVVEKSLAGKGPLPSVVACIVESFIRRVRVSVDDVEIVIRGQKVPEIRVAASVDLRTTHCRVIERRGAAARARLRLSASVGGGALLPGLEVELQRLELPRVLQTLLAPKPLPAKKVSAELLVKRIELEVRPHVVSALMQVSHIFSQFSEWREAMAEEVRGTALPLKPGEKEEYEKALSGRQEVSGWEQRMSAQEILCSHCEAKRWPVPEDMGLQEWIDKLTDEQRPVRAMEISAEVQSLVLELLGDSDLPGRGVLASAVSLCARVGVLDPQVPQDAAGSDSRSPSAAGSPSAASSDGRSPSAASGQLGAFDSGLLRDIGPKKLEARASLGSLEVTCDPPGSLAVPVLEPCLVSAECALHASSSRDTLLLRTECRRALATGEGRDAAVTFNLSGHALWRVQQVLQAMGAAAAAQSMPSEAVDLESERLAAQARASAKRRAAHMADVKRIFDQLDRDRSGSLESDEVDELVASLYGSLMTLEEVKVAGGHLMQMVDTSGDGAVEAQELQDFFLQQNSSESVGTYGPICPNLGDFVVPVPESINLTDTFRRCVCPSFAEAAHGEHAEVLQLRWVRALQNYKVAEATWSETIAPRMEPRFSAWKLHERIPAIDFWNDPTFSLKKLDVSAEHEQRDTTLLCNVDMPGLSLRLADSQHASAMARIRIDVHHLTLSGGVQASANMDTLRFQGLSGNFSMRAGYWNQQHRLVEPFVEPWSLKFEADGNCARVLADHHMVINVTPPLLQALCVAASSLEAAEVPSAAGAVPAEEDVRPVVAYVLNRTFLDVNVSAHGPHGAGKTVRIGRACFDQRVAVEIERERGTSIHRLESGGEQKLWTLTLEGADPLNPWQLDGEITFSVTGRTTFRDVSRKRLIVVDVSVDVRSRAPIVTLSGICRLQNTTGRTLVMSDPEKAFAIKVNPGESREAGVGGGFEVTLFNFESSEVSIPIVTAIMPADEEEIQEDTKQWCGEASGLQRVDCSVVGGGYKFLLLQQRKLVGDSPANDRTLLCVPMLRVLNGLPCEIKILRGAARRAPEGEQRPWLRHFAARRGTPDVPERSQSAEVLTVASGETRGCGDIDPSQPIFLHVDALSFSYTAVIPKDAIHSPHAVRQASRARKQSRAALTSDEAGAPRLEIELGWEGFGAMVTVYARHWVLNKTGWAMEVHSGPEVPKVGRLPEQINLDLGQESMAPAPLAGAPWSAALGAAPPAVAGTGADAGPDVAFLRAPDHKFRLRLRGRPRVSRWAWDSHAEGAELRHWIPGATAPALAPPASDGEGLPPAWESGWSQPLETEIAGTAGEASLPACEAAGGAAFPGGSLGVSISELPPPFLRSRLVTVAPRYVVRNDLEFAVRAWPSLGASRRAPASADGEPDDLPTVQPGGVVALDGVASSTLLASVLGKKASLYVPLISFQAAGTSEVPEVAVEPGEWSVHMPLSVVGDTVFVLSTGNPADPFRVVRASVQLVGATMFVVLVKGKYEYVLRNFSLLHTLAFYQEGAQLKEDFAILKPCTYRGFTFPDPDVPRDLRGRILGAGKGKVVKYDVDDLSKMGRVAGLTLPGLKQLVDVEFQMIGGQRVLTFRDHGARPAPARGGHRVQPQAPAGGSSEGRELLAAGGGLSSALIGLHLDVFLAGLHVCLVDTLRALPQELLGATVDYVQLVKPAGERFLMVEVHNFQCDEFLEGRVLIGPAASGLNSQRSPSADVEGFRALPLFSCAVRGPRLPQNPVYDAERGLLTLEDVAIRLEALEAPDLDVGRLLALALRLQGWTHALDLGVASTARAASQALLKALAKGIPTPQKGGMTICYVERLVVMPISLAADVVLKKRQRAGVEENDGDEDDDEDLVDQLRKLASGLSPALRTVVLFFAKLGTTFAEASPRFVFSKLEKRLDPQNSAVLVSSISMHYTKQLQWQMARVLGSLQVLGDPVGLFGDVREGFQLFFKKTAEELHGQRSSIGSGVVDLVGGTVGGVLGSVANVSGSVKDTLGTVAGGPIGEEKRAESLAEGIDMSFASLAGGISEAVTGLVEQPIEQWETDGALGLLKGSAQGVVGVVTRPIEGVFGAAEKMAQGAEGQVRGMSRGYGGLRRPPRADFGGGERTGAVTAGLRALDRALLWPKWRLQLVDLSLPDVWMERRVRSLVVSLVHEGDQAESDVRVVRGRMADGWALQGGAWLCGTPLGGGGPPAGLAEGRTGLLRGPFRIQVEALVEGNLEMTVPFRVVIGQGELPLGDFSDAMLRPLRQEAQQLRFCVRALPSPIMGPGFSQREGELIGEVTACLAPCVDRKVMPPRFLPDADAARGLPKLGPAAAAGPDRGARAAAGPDPAEPLVRMASMASAAGAAAPPAVVRVASGRPRGAPQ